MSIHGLKQQILESELSWHAIRHLVQIHLKFYVAFIICTHSLLLKWKKNIWVLLNVQDCYLTYREYLLLVQGCSSWYYKFVFNPNNFIIYSSCIHGQSEGLGSRSSSWIHLGANCRYWRRRRDCPAFRQKIKSDISCLISSSICF